MNVTDRFLDFVKFDTQSDELTNMTPSSPGQMEFAKYLKSVLDGMGLEDVELDSNGYLFATLPANMEAGADRGIHCAYRHIARHVGDATCPRAL